MVSTSDTPSRPDAAWKISRLRRVNGSIHTNLASSMRPRVEMFRRPTCCVCSRYTIRAPAAHSPSGIVSTAKPLRLSTRSCRLSFSTAASYTKAHSSRDVV